MENYKLICRRCKILAEVEIIKNNPSRVTCTKCGYSTGYNKAIEEAVLDFSSNSISKMLEETTRNSKYMSYSPAHKKHSPPNFILDIKGNIK